MTKIIGRRDNNNIALIFYYAKCPHCRKEIYIDIEKEEVVHINLTKIKRGFK